MTSAIQIFTEGKAICGGGEIDLSQAPWTPHPDYPGVWYKLLILGEHTAGKFSAGVMKVESGHESFAHAHDQWELHEVIGGTGAAMVGEEEVALGPGVSFVIPDGTPHSIHADVELTMTAKFWPALF